MNRFFNRRIVGVFRDVANKLLGEGAAENFAALVANLSSQWLLTSTSRSFLSMLCSRPIAQNVSG